MHPFCPALPVSPSLLRWSLLLSIAALTGCATVLPPPAADGNDPRAAVRAAEVAFAKTMADRDFDAFARHIADDAVFVNGGQPLRGKAAIVAHWQRFFAAGPAPFSWSPEVVEVVTTSPPLGYTEGAVKSPDGTTFARFHSTWRLEADGRWRVVFDNGQAACAERAAK